MIRRFIRGAAGVATLPVYLLGNALMVPLLKRQLRREQARTRRAEENAAAAERMADRLRHGQAIEGDYVCPDSLRADEAQRKLNMANRTVYEQIEELRRKDNEIDGECMRADENAWQLERARRWSALWHERASEYRHRWRYSKRRLDALDAVAAKEVGALAKRCSDAMAERDTLKARLEGLTRAAHDTSVAVHKAIGALARAGLWIWLPSDGAFVPAGLISKDRPEYVEAMACAAKAADAAATANVRPSVEGDYPDCALTQQWAGIVEKLTIERDTLRREVDTLRRELRQADEAHTADCNQIRGQHRRNLAEALRCPDDTWPELLAAVHRLRARVEPPKEKP